MKLEWNKKMNCPHCGGFTNVAGALAAPHPFDSKYVLFGCPECNRELDVGLRCEECEAGDSLAGFEYPVSADGLQTKKVCVLHVTAAHWRCKACKAIIGCDKTREAIHSFDEKNNKCPCPYCNSFTSFEEIPV